MERQHGVSGLKLKLICFKAMFLDYITAAHVEFGSDLHMKRLLERINFLLWI
jgi:hypothetical protein